LCPSDDRLLMASAVRTFLAWEEALEAAGLRE
jgi:hypothetical protein